MSESLSAWVRNSAAWSSKAVAIAGASWSVVPSSSMSPTKLAVPGLPDGSVSSPARTTSSTVASGTWCCSTIHTARPFFSARTVGTGGWNVTGAPASGSVFRKGASGVPVSDTPASGRDAAAVGAPAGAGVPDVAQARRKVGASSARRPRRSMAFVLTGPRPCGRRPG